MSDNSSETQKDNLILPTFLIILLDVADLIFEKMDPMDLLTTRKVSRDLRTAVDKFGICFDMISVRMRYTYYRKVSIYFDETKVKYESCSNGGTNIIHKEKRWKIEEENCVERALKDLKLVMLSNYIKLSLEEHVEEPYEACPYVNAFTHFIAWLESKECVQVEYIRLKGFTFDKVLTILPYLDAKWLQVIHLEECNQLEQFERITHLDQWTSDIKFIFDGDLKYYTFNFEQIDHLFQIKSFIITVDEFSVQNTIKIRDDLMKRSTFNSCEIFFDASKTNREDIANVFDSDSTRRYPWMLKYQQFDVAYFVGNIKFASISKSA